MPDLTTRLLAEIERREGVATTCQSVHSGWWHVDQDRDPNLDMMTVLDGGRIYAHTDLGQDARFIADNDPHTVLAYLAALRGVVERCTDGLKFDVGCCEGHYGDFEQMLEAVAEALGIAP